MKAAGAILCSFFILMAGVSCNKIKYWSFTGKCWDVVSYYVNDIDSTQLLKQHAEYSPLAFQEYTNGAEDIFKCNPPAGTNSHCGHWSFEGYPYKKFDIKTDIYFCTPLPIGAFINYPKLTIWDILELKRKTFIIETVQNGNKYYLEFKKLKN